MNTSIASLLDIEQEGQRVTLVRFAIGPKGQSAMEAFVGAVTVEQTLACRSGAACRCDVIAALHTIWPNGWKRRSYDVRDGWGIYVYGPCAYSAPNAYDALLAADDLERADRKVQGDSAMKFVPGESGTIAHWATPPSL